MAGYLNIENLSFIYPGYRGLKNSHIFRNLSFSVDKGEIAVFLAPPGSGKTTLSRIITALVPRYTGGTLEGRVTVGDTDLLEEKPYNLISLAGIVFQNPEEQIITPEVESEIGFSLEASGLDYELIRKRTDEAIDKISLESLRGMNPAVLSGGEKRKLLFAALEAQNPDIWILDETLEEIDPEGRVMLLDLLRKEKKTVLVLTSKMLDIYRKYCGRFYLFDGNSLIGEKSAPGEAFIDRALECGVFLDTEKLRKTIKHSSKDPEKPCTVIMAENIAFSYGKNRFRLKVDEFSLIRGEVTVLLGRNGSGKSTLAKLVSGLLVPESGKILLDNGDGLIPADTGVLNRNVSYLFQNPDFQLFLPTVGDELLFGLREQFPDRDERQRMIEEAAALFRLESLDAPPAIMSYGARKRLQAAVYYLLDKKIVIIDEADSGLSFNDYALILNNFRKLSPPPAIMIISHDIKLASGLADRVFLMEKGSIDGGNTEKRIRELLDISMAGGG